MSKQAGFAVVVALALGACASTGWPTSADDTAMSDTPDHFLVVDASSGAKSEPTGDTTCHSPLADPRDGSRLSLERSSGGFGDYRPDAPRYGLAEGQLLRIDCRTGRPVGAARE